MTYQKTKPKNLYSFQESSRAEIKDFVELNHYSHNINGLKITKCFKIMRDSELVGACIFGELSTTAWKKYGDSEKDVLELRRLVLKDECVFNSESWFISKCLKWLKKNTEYKVVVSYADPNYGHSGIIYKASNFEYLGRTATDIVLEDTTTGKIYHSRAMRTKYKGKLKPFAKRLQELDKKGLLNKKKVSGKHIYVYKLKKV